jgi:hypothetical protein
MILDNSTALKVKGLPLCTLMSLPLQFHDLDLARALGEILVGVMMIV